MFGRVNASPAPASGPRPAAPAPGGITAFKGTNGTLGSIGQAKAAPYKRNGVLRPGWSKTVQMVPTFEKWSTTYNGSEEQKLETYFNTQLFKSFKTLYEYLEEAVFPKKLVPESMGIAVHALYKAMAEAKKGVTEQNIEKLDKCALLLTRYENEVKSYKFIREMLGPYFSIADYARLRSVSKVFSQKTTNMQVVKLQKPYEVSYTFADVIKAMKGYEFGGLHGSSSFWDESLYQGISPPSTEQKNYKTSQLGPGFYLTDGRTQKLNVSYAKSIAEESVKKIKTDKQKDSRQYLYRVFIKDLSKLEAFDVPKEHWSDMERDIVPSELTGHTKNYDLLKSQIVKNEPATQIKVNPRAYGNIRILPPIGLDGKVTDEDIRKWLRIMAENFQL